MIVLGFSILLILAGLFFHGVAVVGILRLPDFYTRSHAVGAADSLGAVLLMSGLVLLEGFTLTSVKMVFVICFIYLANPISTHVLVRAALRSGLKIWTRKGPLAQSEASRA